MLVSSPALTWGQTTGMPRRPHGQHSTWRGRGRGRYARDTGDLPSPAAAAGGLWGPRRGAARAWGTGGAHPLCTARHTRCRARAGGGGPESKCPVVPQGEGEGGTAEDRDLRGLSRAHRGHSGRDVAVPHVLKFMERKRRKSIHLVSHYKIRVSGGGGVPPPPPPPPVVSPTSRGHLPAAQAHIRSRCLGMRREPGTRGPACTADPQGSGGLLSAQSLDRRADWRWRRYPPPRQGGPYHQDPGSDGASDPLEGLGGAWHCPHVHKERGHWMRGGRPPPPPAGSTGFWRQTCRQHPARTPALARSPPPHHPPPDWMPHWTVQSPAAIHRSVGPTHIQRLTQ